MRNRREVVESKFLCSMIPCFSTVDCTHQGDDVNVVIVLELEQNHFFNLKGPEDTCLDSCGDLQSEILFASCLHRGHVSCRLHAEDIEDHY